MIFRIKNTLLCLLALCIGAALFVSGCSSAPVVTDETTAAEIIQRAQEASDRNRYGQALGYYEILLQRYSGNIEMVCIGEYEIAFIHYKQKKYPQAREELTALLARYENAAPGAAPMPPQFRKLAGIVLGKIDEKEKNKDPIAKFLMFFKKKETKPPTEDSSG